MKILDRLPVLSESKIIHFGEQQVRLHRDSLFVWVSISLTGERNPLSISPPFPALIDTGNNSAFYLHEHHLVNWAGIQPNQLGIRGSRRINKQHLPFRDANVWTYPKNLDHQIGRRVSSFVDTFARGEYPKVVPRRSSVVILATAPAWQRDP